MAAFFSASLTTTKCHVCEYPAVGACCASWKHSSSTSRSTGRVRSSRFRTARVVESSSSGVRSSRGTSGSYAAAQQGYAYSGPRSSADRAAAFEAARGGSIPPGATPTRSSGDRRDELPLQVREVRVRVDRRAGGSSQQLLRRILPTLRMDVLGEPLAQ